MARYRFNPRKSGEWLEAYFFLLFAIFPAVSILVNLENGWKMGEELLVRVRLAVSILVNLEHGWKRDRPECYGGLCRVSILVNLEHGWKDIVTIGAGGIYKFQSS